MLDQIVGNERIKGYLNRMLAKGNVGHSLLFAGPEGVGKSLFAEAFAKMLLCQHDPKGFHLHKLRVGSHPDLHIYRPEGKTGMHTIAAMRGLSEEVALPPNEAARKVFVIHDADRMLTYSANALLKTFEEPSPDTIILLVSSAPELLLPTILSRCNKFHFQALTPPEMVKLLTQQKGVSQEEATRIAIFSQGSVSKAFRLCDGSKDPMCEAVLQMLSAGKFTGYSRLLAKSKELAELVEGAIKRVEGAAKQELLKGYCDKLTPNQRESVEKELEGVAAMQQMHEADTLFEVILAWYRDLHLLRSGGNPEYLYNQDYLDLLQQKATSDEKILPMEELLDAIKATKTFLARSTGLSICLENLFLRLNLL